MQLAQRGRHISFCTPGQDAASPTAGAGTSSSTAFSTSTTCPLTSRCIGRTIPRAEGEVRRRQRLAAPYY